MTNGQNTQRQVTILGTLVSHDDNDDDVDNSLRNRL